jgi:3'-5' exoribonuclease
VDVGGHLVRTHGEGIVDQRVLEAKKILWDANARLPERFRDDINPHVLDDDRFYEAPGGVTKHHDYRHGLVIHVSEVMQNVQKMTNQNPSPTLVTAVIWHDYMKVREYEMELGWDGLEKVVKMPYRNLIRHVAGSAMEFHRVAFGWLEYEELETVEHLLLSHHGRREWGSPIEPSTADAFILHAADQMSANGVNL